MTHEAFDVRAVIGSERRDDRGKHPFDPRRYIFVHDALPVTRGFRSPAGFLEQRDREFIAFARPDLAVSGMGSSFGVPEVDSRVAVCAQVAPNQPGMSKAASKLVDRRA